MSDVDWSRSKTGNEMWKNPFIPIENRLLICDGAISFRDEVIKNLRNQIKQIEKELQDYL